MAGDEGGARVAAHGALQDVDHPGVVDDARLVVQPPVDGVHHPVVRLVHLLVHPDGVGHVDVDGQAEVGAAIEEGSHSRVVEVQALRLAEPHAQALVSLLAHALRALADAALELGDGRRAVAGLVVARVVEAAPELEARRVAGVELDDPVELLPVRLGEEDGLLDAHLVHDLHPAVHVLGRLRPGVGVHVDRGVAGLRHGRDGDLVDRDGLVVLQQDLVGRLRGRRRGLGVRGAGAAERRERAARRPRDRRSRIAKELS